MSESTQLKFKIQTIKMSIERWTDEINDLRSRLEEYESEKSKLTQELEELEKEYAKKYGNEEA